MKVLDRTKIHPLIIAGLTMSAVVLVASSFNISAYAQDPPKGWAPSGASLEGSQAELGAGSSINLSSLPQGVAGSKGARPFIQQPNINRSVPNKFRVDRSTETPSSPQSQSSSEPLQAGTLSGTGFLASADDNTRIPPDTTGAAGLTNVVGFTNTEIRVRSRADGSSVSSNSLSTFWSGCSGNMTVFDPVVLYDPFSDRWVATVAAYDSDNDNSLLLVAVSDINDAINWTCWSVDSDVTEGDPDTTNATFFDFPRIGFNKKWITIQANMYNNSDSDLNNSTIVAFDKADLYAEAVSPDYSFINLPWSTYFGSTMVPASDYDNLSETMHLFEDWNGSFDGVGYIRQSTITGNVGSEVFNIETSFPTSLQTWTYTGTGTVGFAPQLGSSTKVATNDSRMQNCVLRNTKLWCTQTVFLPDTGVNRSSIQWWQMFTDGTVAQTGVIDDSTGKVFYAFPWISVNKYDDALIGYSFFSSTVYPSTGYSFRFHGDAMNTFQARKTLKAGVAKYVKTFGGTRNRWGDYSGGNVDPTNDTDFWTVGEYAAAPNGSCGDVSPFCDRWGTWWGNIVPTTTFQPDGQIRASSGYYVGGNIYNITGSGQTKTSKTYRGKTVSFYVNIQNDGTDIDRLYVLGTGSYSGRFTVNYYSGSTNISTAVKAGTYLTAPISPGSYKTIKITIKVGSSAPHKKTRYHNLTSTSLTDDVKKDLVRAGVYVY